MANNENLKPFQKGYDPRRNIRGVPKETIAARKRLREIMAELLDMPDGKGEATRLDTMFRYMTGIRSTPKDREMILKGLYPGLLKDEVDVTSNGETLAPKVDDERFDRAISSLADALRESVPGTGMGTLSDVDTAK